MAAPASGNGGSIADIHLRLTLETSIPSDVRFIERIVALVQRQCRELSYPNRQCALNIPVALAEAIANAILYGNLADPGKAVRVHADANAERVVIEVVDEGSGFDLERSVIDPTAPENIRREDGRGLYLMLKLMHRVERFTRDGNVVRLTLRRDE
ncbi:MAG TPA: ATP-binding protein [Gemmatimonadaceae bacterium]|nr:ATP-binding protein [Gemmatimonadaceae bacterium]